MTGYKLDARHDTVTGKIQVPAGSQPHGLRIAPDGSKGYIALLQGKGLGILDLPSGKLEVVPLNGAAVQTAITPDGKVPNGISLWNRHSGGTP